MHRFHLETRDPRPYLQITFGLFVFAVGIVLILKSNLGMGPWDVFHVGITHYLPLTLGRVTQITGLIIIILSFLLGIYPGIGTILNMILLGFFVDLTNPCVPSTHHLPLQCLFLGTGIMLVGIGSGLYINSNLGTGPRDSLMLGLTTRTGKSIRFIRASMEICVLTTGFFLQGPVGIGTVAFALGIGPAVQFFMKITPKQGSETQEIE